MKGKKHIKRFNFSNYNKMKNEEQNIDNQQDGVLPCVTNRTFNVGDNVKWRGMDLIVVEVGIGEILIATTQNVEDDNYNDWWVGTQYVC